MREHPLFERLWNGSAQMEEWTAAVSQGTVTAVADNIITVHTTYFCGSVTADPHAGRAGSGRHGQSGDRREGARSHQDLGR